MTEQTIFRIFQNQKAEPSLHLQAIVEMVGRKYLTEENAIADDELDVWAAGDGGYFSDAPYEDKRHE